MIKTEGIVLSKRSSYNDDVFLTVFTKKYGIMDVVAKRAKSLRSAFNSSTGVFVRDDMILQPKNSAFELVSADILESNLGILEDIESISSASYMVELLRKTLGAEQAEEEIYSLLSESLAVVSKRAASLRIVRCHFVCNLCFHLGVLPSMKVCNRCGRESESADCERSGAEFDRGGSCGGGGLLFLSPVDGRVCEDCRDSVCSEISAKFFRYVEYLRGVRPRRLAHTVVELELVRTATDFCEGLLRYNFGVEFIKSKELLDL